MIDKESMPKHIAIILDGNRRWAKERGKPAAFGHQEGAKKIERIVKYANKIGLKYLTVYAFSTENWKRAEDEVKALMFIFQSYFDDFLKRQNSGNVKIQFLGDKTALSEKLQNSMEKCVEKTKNNTGLTFNIALNYGGRNELVNAIKNISKEVKDGKLKIDDINEELVSQNLYTSGMPDPDLVIRTSGEMRLSNFLLWQIAYSEFLFVEKNWPDFKEEDLDKAIEEYSHRHRKFGAN